MTRTESNMLTMAAVILTYLALVGGLLLYAGPDMLALISPR